MHTYICVPQEEVSLSNVSFTVVHVCTSVPLSAELIVWGKEQEKRYNFFPCVGVQRAVHFIGMFSHTVRAQCHSMLLQFADTWCMY